MKNFIERILIRFISSPEIIRKKLLSLEFPFFDDKINAGEYEKLIKDVNARFPQFEYFMKVRLNILYKDMYASRSKDFIEGRIAERLFDIENISRKEYNSMLSGAERMYQNVLTQEEITSKWLDGKNKKVVNQNSKAKGNG